VDSKAAAGEVTGDGSGDPDAEHATSDSSVISDQTMRVLTLGRAG
jgi:hypothetical protein